MSKKKVITTYTVSRDEIEKAVLTHLRNQHRELEDEFEANLVFKYGDGNKLNAQTKLEAVIEFVEEREVDK